MKRIVTIPLLLIVFNLIGNKLSAQQATSYQAGSALRIDFEGRHKMVNHSATDSASYHPGTVLRVDFEGLHSVKNQQQSTSEIYQPGAVLRIDFEGRHKKQQ